MTTTTTMPKGRARRHYHFTYLNHFYVLGQRRPLLFHTSMAWEMIRDSTFNPLTSPYHVNALSFEFLGFHTRWALAEPVHE